MKLMNYDTRTLIYQNVRYPQAIRPKNQTKRQYAILCRLIRQKKITKQSFDILLVELFGISDWKQLNYSQMYEIIFILTHWDYQKVRL